MSSPLTIMCFTWNAAGLRLCETMSQVKADTARSGLRGVFKTKCITPDFFRNITDTIDTEKPGLLVITTQGEDSTDSYFHSTFLPYWLSEINYDLLKRDKLSDVGEKITTKLITGIPSGTALRMSVYSRNDLIKDFKAQERALDKLVGNDGQLNGRFTDAGRNAGAICSYVWHPKYGKFAFIAAHLPSGINVLDVQGTNFDTYRSSIKAANTLALNNFSDHFVGSLPTNAKPDHIFLLGDLNYDIVIPGQSNINILQVAIDTANISRLISNDELQEAKKHVPFLKDFKEGTNGIGPLFVPTWRLKRDRPDSCSKTVTTSCFETPSEKIGGVAWHDRILYKDSANSLYVIDCLTYDRVDIKNMHYSTHAGAIGTYRIISR